jgi:hypothetical protein
MVYINESDSTAPKVHYEKDKHPDGIDHTQAEMGKVYVELDRSKPDHRVLFRMREILKPWKGITRFKIAYVDPESGRYYSSRERCASDMGMQVSPFNQKWHSRWVREATPEEVAEFKEAERKGKNVGIW